MSEALAILLFAAVCGCLLAGFPVAFTLAGVSFLFALGAAAFGLFDLSLLAAWPQRIFGAMTNDTLIVIPLFILMGMFLERSKIAADLLEIMSRCFGRRAGGLAISVTLVSTLLAASTGIVGATVITMGLLALPVMLRRGYDSAYSAGSIAATGTLGQIIPPSIVLVILGDQMSSAYQKAQLEQGIFSPDTVSVGDLFAGALFPGLLVAGLYIVYQAGRAFYSPASSPPLFAEDEDAVFPSAGELVRVFLIPAALIITVLGSILAGVATPTEAAGAGAAGAALIAAARQPAGGRIAGLALACLAALFALTLAADLPARMGGANPISDPVCLAALLLFGLFLLLFARIMMLLHASAILAPSLAATARMTSMVFAILIGAALFSLVFRGLEGDAFIRDVLTSLPGGVWGVFLLVMLAIFLLGFVLDFLEISFIVVPVVAPILLAMGLDPVWLGVMIALNLQTSFLTPPFGFALFYIRGVAPDDLPTHAIYRSVVPFIAIQIAALALTGLFPALATWLPAQLFP